LNINDFSFDLPPELVAQHPLPERDQSRMMVVWRRTGKREHLLFSDLPDILGPHCFLVLNNTRVIPARLRAHRPGKAEQVEVLLIREMERGLWLALVKPARKALVGQVLEIRHLRALVVEAQESGRRILRFEPNINLVEVLDQIGETPLPPYIHRHPEEEFAEDRTRYQTIYADSPGSVAAPTAGLHFTDRIFRRLEDRGIGRCEILLHVGYGTFQPVRCEEIENHRMEPEYFEVSEAAASFVRNEKLRNHHLIAVGTTTTRVLEHLALRGEFPACGARGFCDLFIYPGFGFQMLDGLLTNFHLPRSTLFMLVCAFADKHLMMDCYREAIAAGYRFFSYGDCMLLL
jgi:S-adenosylmethionine:tRNA ribosyltransferase-isomerase